MHMSPLPPPPLLQGSGGTVDPASLATGNAAAAASAVEQGVKGEGGRGSGGLSHLSPYLEHDGVPTRLPTYLPACFPTCLSGQPFLADSVTVIVQTSATAISEASTATADAVARAAAGVCNGGNIEAAAEAAATATAVATGEMLHASLCLPTLALGLYRRCRMLHRLASRSFRAVRLYSAGGRERSRPPIAGDFADIQPATMLLASPQPLQLRLLRVPASL